MKNVTTTSNSCAKSLAIEPVACAVSLLERLDDSKERENEEDQSAPVDELG